MFAQLNVFKVLLFITKHSIEHQLFVYTQLNDQTVPFETIQFSKSTVFLFTQLNLKTAPFQIIQFIMRIQFKCLTVLFDP